MVNGVDVDAKQCAIQHHERWITIADVFEAAIHKQYRLVEAPSISIADRLDRNDRLWKYVNIVLCVDLMLYDDLVACIAFMLYGGLALCAQHAYTWAAKANRHWTQCLEMK